MKQRVVAKRYAKAIFELAREAGILPRISIEMRQLKMAAAGIPSMIRGFSDERFDPSKRAGAAGEVARVMGFSTEMTSALKLVVERGRAQLLPMIADDFEIRLERHDKLLHGRMRVASASDAEGARSRVEKILSEALGTPAVCDVEVDENLLGGFSLRLGDMLYDASLRGSLAKLKEELMRT